MKRFLLSLTVLALAAMPLAAQTILFSEDFESGSVKADWGLYRAGEEMLQAVPMTSAPAVLANGGSYVGFLQDIDASYSGAAIALAGTESDQNYSIEADVYCYVNDAGGSAYTGLVVYADSSVGIYEKLVADFDANDRFRLYNNQLDYVTFQYSFSQSIPATGLYTDNAWHHMKLTVNTVDTSKTTFSCYFDGALIGDAEYADTSKHQMESGKFGLYSFQMDNDGIPGYFDNVVVTTNTVSVKDVKDLQPGTFSLQQNYPNPFNPTTNIDFVLEEAGFVNLSVYDVTGQLVRTLVNGQLVAGQKSVTWDATDYNKNSVAPGVYFYTLRGENFSTTKKMVLIK